MPIIFTPLQQPLSPNYHVNMKMSVLLCPVSVIYSGIVARGMLLLPSAWMTFSRARTLTRRRGNEQETTIRHVAPIQPYIYEDQSRATYFELTCNAIDTVFRA